MAADGSRSLARAQLGVRSAGQPAMQELVNVHFTSPMLGRRLMHTDPAMLYFVYNEKVVLVMVAHDLPAGEFVAQVQAYLKFGPCMLKSLHIPYA